MSKNPISQIHQKRLDSISFYLRELRFAEGMTQFEISQEFKLHKNTIWRVENGMNFTLVTLFEIADLYDIPISEVLGDII